VSRVALPAGLGERERDLAGKEKKKRRRGEEEMV
jgi:hypothetical protein